MLKRTALIAVAGLCGILTACAPSANGGAERAISEVAGRSILFSDYPQPGKTYLSFSSAHGFQVNYLTAGGQAYLWYPGNSVILPEDYKRDVVAGRQALCWRHRRNTYNPVTKQRGGAFACTPLDMARKTIVAEVSGDPFKLASGTLPYRLDRCTAPDVFRFDREKYRC